MHYTESIKSIASTGSTACPFCATHGILAHPKWLHACDASFTKISAIHGSFEENMHGRMQSFTDVLCNLQTTHASMQSGSVREPLIPTCLTQWHPAVCIQLYWFVKLKSSSVLASSNHNIQPQLLQHNTSV